MKALIARLRRMIGKYTVAIIIVGGIAAGVVMTVRVDGFLEVILKPFVTMLAFIAVTILVGIARALTKYRLAKATKPYEKVVDPLIKSGREYCSSPILRGRWKGHSSSRVQERACRFCVRTHAQSDDGAGRRHCRRRVPLLTHVCDC